jgi:hypothetical protein
MAIDFVSRTVVGRSVGRSVETRTKHSFHTHGSPPTNGPWLVQLQTLAVWI